MRSGVFSQARTPSAFSAFVRDNFADMRTACASGTPHQAVMSALSARWREHKAAVGSECQAGDDSSAAVRSLASALARIKL